MFELRPAREEDFPAIRNLIHSVGINPTGLDWRRFLLAVTPEDEMIGCGQIKPHQDGSRELASIAVQKDWRGRGVASAIIERLVAGSDGPLYLTCRASLGKFYQRFGFRHLKPDEMPPYFRRINQLASLASGLHLFHEDLWVMKRG